MVLISPSFLLPALLLFSPILGVVAAPTPPLIMVTPPTPPPILDTPPTRLPTATSINDHSRCGNGGLGVWLKLQGEQEGGTQWSHNPGIGIRIGYNEPLHSASNSGGKITLEVDPPWAIGEYKNPKTGQVTQTFKGGVCIGRVKMTPAELSNYWGEVTPPGVEYTTRSAFLEKALGKLKRYRSFQQKKPENRLENVFVRNVRKFAESKPRSK
ncbi:hypothetical protein F5878DRAFT_602450 [Lentinula raphanica]|uniref:Uncharacterized protein n=1 Tax=Lentinula raphanica TaxID=153919 RepID=A0AA38PKC7_9AGAR|nr:hypothetical protein F5878DRAFT_602450 [Lentinula raphanica]